MKRQVNRIPLGVYGCSQIVPPFEVEDDERNDGFQVVESENESDDAD